jgi:hypothetical protein
MGIRISKDHLHPSVIESITSLIGDLNQLETTAKGNAVEAINELLANGGNKEELEALIAEIAEGKELIANAVGEPLTAEDSFNEMSNDINSLLSTFKTNMMNNGVTVESSDRFKSLIDKIATMVEDGEGKGIQFAEGECNVSNIGDIKQFAYMTNNKVSESYRYGSITLDFVPQFVYFRIFYVYYVYSVPMKFITHVIYDPLENNCLTIINSNMGTGDGSIYINSVEATIEHFVPIIEDNTYYYPVLEDDGESTIEYSISDSYWYAIGVGEEDTTLRDSLASILTEEGVNVTEEDDMADLISKVDEEFDRKNANTVLEVEGTCTFKELTNGVNIGFQPTNVYISLPYSSGYNGKHVRCFFQDKYTKQAVSLYIIDGQWEQNAYGIEPTTTGFYGYLGISVSDSTVVTYKACKYF